MRLQRSRILLIGSAVLAALVLALYSTNSAADKSFTLRMEDEQRKSWNASFNKLMAESFDSLECKADASLKVPFAKGCVDAGDVVLCCDSWTIWLKCTGEGGWQQGDIDGSSCSKRTKPKK